MAEEQKCCDTTAHDLTKCDRSHTRQAKWRAAGKRAKARPNADEGAGRRSRLEWLRLEVKTLKATASPVQTISTWLEAGGS